LGLVFPSRTNAAFSTGSWASFQEKITQQRWLMRAWMFAAPLGFIAIDTGWIVRCDSHGHSMGKFCTADSASYSGW